MPPAVPRPLTTPDRRLLTADFLGPGPEVQPRLISTLKIWSTS
jgi:hypothetical protein